MVECQLPKLDVAGSSPVARFVSLTPQRQSTGIRMPHSPTCPTCRQAVSWQGNPFRPFCSDRCRTLDLGAWADEAYRIPGEPGEPEVEPGEPVERRPPDKPH